MASLTALSIYAAALAIYIHIRHTCIIYSHIYIFISIYLYIIYIHIYNLIFLCRDVLVVGNDTTILDVFFYTETILLAIKPIHCPYFLVKSVLFSFENFELFACMMFLLFHHYYGTVTAQLGIKY